MKVYFRDTVKVCFDEIEVGECFMYGDELFMRTTPCKNVAGRDLNAVNLGTGRMMSFAGRNEDESCDLVTAVEADVNVSVKLSACEEDS